MPKNITVGDISLSVPEPQDIARTGDKYKIGAFTFHQDMDRQSVEAGANELLQEVVNRLAAVKASEKLQEDERALSRLRQGVMSRHGFDSRVQYSELNSTTQSLIDSLVDIELAKEPKAEIPKQELPEEGMYYIYHKFVGVVVGWVTNGQVYRIDKVYNDVTYAWKLVDITKKFKEGSWITRGLLEVKED